MNFSVVQRKFGHTAHIFFSGQSRPDYGEAKSAEKQQQRDDAEPLDTLDGLKQIFVHIFSC